MFNAKKELTIIILAAGLGTRLGDLTKSKPKSLTLVNGKPLIAYSIAWAKLFEPARIIVVGGYLFDQLKSAVASIDPAVMVVENNNYATTQRMVSLKRAQPHIVGDMAVFDGDYIYHNSIAEKIKSHLKGVKIFAADRQAEDVVLDMMVLVDKEDHLVTMSKSLTDFNYYFNSFFFCSAAHQDDYFKSADKALEKIGADKTHLEDALLEYVSSGGVVDVVNLGKPLWIEIDNPQELKVAEALAKNDFHHVRCALCDSDDYAVVCATALQKDGTKRALTNVVCLRCGLIYNNPMPTDKELEAYYTGGHVKDHAFIDNDYDSYIKRLQAKQPEKKANESVDFIRPFLHGAEKVLDIGCSHGVLLSELQKQLAVHGTGVEPDPLMSRVALEYYGVKEVKNMFFEDFIRDSPGQFDMVIIRHVFEHLKNPNLVIEQLKQLMKPGGFLYLVIPNAADFLESRTLERALEYGHVYSYSPHAIAHMLLKHGLKIIKWSHDYVHHQQMVITFIDTPFDAVSLHVVSDGLNVTALQARLKLQDYRYYTYCLRRKINQFLPFSIMNKKWKGAKDEE